MVCDEAPASVMIEGLEVKACSYLDDSVQGSPRMPCLTGLI